VRAGVVKRAEDWRWSTVHDYTGNLSAAVSAHAFWPFIVYCCRLMKEREFEGKAAESLKNETLRSKKERR
jgi:hypothetical protein